MKELDSIKTLINQGDVEQAIDRLEALLKTDFKGKDTVYYLLGNAYRKQGDWQQALNHYSLSIELNPDGPAFHARQMVMDILNFYHKDMYNQ